MYTGRTVVSNNGNGIEGEKLDEIARKAIETILSELPEEVRTYDIVNTILEEAKYKFDDSVQPVPSGDAKGRTGKERE